MTINPPSRSRISPDTPRSGVEPGDAVDAPVVHPAEQASETFCQAVAHHLRAPLRAIEGYAVP